MSSNSQAQNTDKLQLFRTRLKAAMARKGAVLRNLAEVTGKGISTAGSWTQGKNWPEVESLEKIAGYLDVSVDFLVSGRSVTPTAEMEEPTPAEIDRATAVGEDPAPYGEAAMIEREIRAHVDELVAAAGGDVRRLGWIAEQLRQHVNEPTHWGMHERVLGEILEEDRQRGRDVPRSPAKAAQRDAS